jgi:hypothetical protein
MTAHRAGGDRMSTPRMACDVGLHGGTGSLRRDSVLLSASTESPACTWRLVSTDKPEKQTTP